MIEVTYLRKKHRVKVKGHAYCGDAGKDLVCSAATILACTIATNLKNLSEAEPKNYRRLRLTLENGRADLGISPVHNTGNIVTLLLDGLCLGFALLANSYPDAVQYSVE